MNNINEKKKGRGANVVKEEEQNVNTNWMKGVKKIKGDRAEQIG